VGEYLALADPEERKKVYAKLKRERSIAMPQEYFDRMIRAAAQPKGLTKDRPLTLGSTQSPGEYTIYVPKAYDPRRPWPLIIGLHGGGPGGKDGKEVVGDGPSAMNFYVRQAEARGYLVVCPTALEAPWAASPNFPFLRSLIDEVKLLYNVDVNRIYMTGHSMGGFGTWYFAPKFAEELAAASPMAGGGGPSPVFEATNTPVFIFHGADDGVVPPVSDRSAAKSMKDAKLDWHYTELTGVLHGFPHSILLELFDFFDTRRLAVGRGRKVPTLAVRSSFLAKVSRDEKRFLGDPLEYGAAGAGGKSEWKKLLKDLKLGGGSAEAAATRLGELAEKDSVKPIGDLIRNRSTPDDVKAQAARALGIIGHADGYAGLAAGLKTESHDVVTASAVAMAAIGAPKAGEALKGALGHVVKILEGKKFGDRIHISDWKAWLPALTAVVKSVGEAKVEGGAAAIHKTAVRGIYGGTWAVAYSAGVPMQPWAPRLTLAEAICEAILALDQAGDRDGGRAALIEMKNAKPDPRDTKHASVVAAAEAALAKLPD
ncbi:MAG: HEAT repeat domain-containing protein, partial [Planctomycetota bacterium]